MKFLLKIRSSNFDSGLFLCRSLMSLLVALFMLSCNQSSIDQESGSQSQSAPKPTPMPSPSAGGPSTEQVLAMASNTQVSSADLLKEFDKLTDTQIKELNSYPGIGKPYFLPLVTKRPMDGNTLKIFTKYFTQIGTATFVLAFEGDDGNQKSVYDAICEHKGAKEELDAKLNLLLLFFTKSSFPIKSLLLCNAQFLSHLLNNVSEVEAQKVIGSLTDAELEGIVEVLVLDAKISPNNDVAFAAMRQLYKLADAKTKKRFWHKIPQYYEAHLMSPYGINYKSFRNDLGMPENEP